MAGKKRKGKSRAKPMRRARPKAKPPALRRAAKTSPGSGIVSRGSAEQIASGAAGVGSAVGARAGGGQAAAKSTISPGFVAKQSFATPREAAASQGLPSGKKAAAREIAARSGAIMKGGAMRVAARAAAFGNSVDVKGKAKQVSVFFRDLLQKQREAGASAARPAQRGRARLFTPQEIVDYYRAHRELPPELQRRKSKK